VLPQETDGRKSGSQHNDEPGDRAAAALISPGAARGWPDGVSRRATWLDLQPGRDEWRDFYLLLSLLHTRVDVKFLPIVRIGTRRPASAKSADRMTL